MLWLVVWLTNQCSGIGKLGFLINRPTPAKVHYGGVTFPIRWFQALANRHQYWTKQRPYRTC